MRKQAAVGVAEKVNTEVEEELRALFSPSLFML